MIHESIRKGLIGCDNSYPCSTHKVSCKHITSSLPLKCYKKYGSGKMKPSSRICNKKDTGKYKTSSQNSSEPCQSDNLLNSNNENNSMNTHSDNNTKESILNPVIMDDCNNHQNEHCNDTQSNQSIFFDLLSKLERHLDEERKANAKLQAELMNKTEYEKQLSDLRSNYEAEVFRLQNVITRLQGNSHYDEKISHDDDDDEKLMNLNTEVNGVNVRRNNDVESNIDNSNKHAHNFTTMDELKKEYEKQELLIAGYQRENEKLYACIKKLRKNNPTETEDSQTAKRLTTENLSLRVEVEQLNKELKLRSQQICTMLSGNSRLNQEELNKQLDNEKNKLMKELNDTHLELTNMNIKMNNSINEKNDLLEKYELFKEKSQTDFINMKENFLNQIENLQKKLRWYIENQSIIIKDSKKLHNQARELEKLQAELSYFKSKQVSGAKSNESKQAHDSKDSSTEDQQVFLLERIKFLESELDRAHENEKRAIRALQQQYERVKLQYEDRIQSLESYINSYCIPNQMNSTLQEIDNLKSIDLNNIENKSIKPSNQSIKQSINSNQSIIISNLFHNLRDQIINLKIQLNERQKIIDELRHFTQLNNSYVPTVAFVRLNNYLHASTPEFGAKISFVIPGGETKEISSKEKSDEDVSINDKVPISLKKHIAVENLLQSRITKLGTEQEKSQESVKSGVTCDASTNTDFIESTDHKTDDSYIKVLERQVKNQMDTIVSRQTELNRLKKVMANQNKHYHHHHDLHHHLHDGNKCDYHLNTSQYTNENIPSSLLQIEDDSNIEVYMNEMGTNHNYYTNLEAIYWRNMVLNMNNELNNLQNDANILVNILTKLQ
uniref:Centrosomal protein of 162 kDa n=1 Tax=Schistosoma mansoni TaxID=6183 RepID=A0A3Q0KPD0_SCHMA